MKYNIPPPRDWQPFEDLCRDLWARLWRDPNATKHGRTGQKQYGVDVFGQPEGSGGWEGVQCKRYERQLTRAEVEREVEEARAFEPGLLRLMIATTTKSDTGAQELVREISDAEVARGSFSVSLWSWDDIAEEVVKYPDLFQHHYPTLPVPTPPAADGGAPFEPWKPAVPPWFVGRRRALHRLESALGRRYGISIVGGDKIGKSSLLLAWLNHLRGSGRRACLIDGQGAAGGSEAAFVAEIIGQRVAEGADPAADALAAWVTVELEGQTPVVLVDEFDQLPQRFDLRFFERLRNLLDTVILVVASRREIDTLFREKSLTSPFDNRLRMMRLGLLEQAAAQELIDRGEEVLDPEDRRLMHQWAGRHPFYLQLLGHSLVEARELGESRDEGLDHFRDQAEARLRGLWNGLSSDDQEKLQRSARGQPRPSKPLFWRGLLDADGRPFGNVLTAWLREST